MTMRWLHEWPTFWAGLLVVGVFYALLVGLIAVATWENHSRIEDVVTGEAVAVSDLYRDMEAYPPPLREELRGLVRQYVRVVIEREWPLQLRGKAPTKVVDHVDQPVHRMVTFEPATPGQQIAHGECLRQLNAVLSLRRQRLQAVDDGLSGLMWLIVLLGAAITIGLTFFFCTDKVRIQALLTVSLSALIGLSIFLIFTLDRPLVGDDAVQPESFQDALSTMKP
jgi:hypothetical protein